jgi:hypothetical protein
VSKSISKIDDKIKTSPEVTKEVKRNQNWFLKSTKNMVANPQIKIEKIENKIIY